MCGTLIGGWFLRFPDLSHSLVNGLMLAVWIVDLAIVVTIRTRYGKGSIDVWFWVIVTSAWVGSNGYGFAIGALVAFPFLVRRFTARCVVASPSAVQWRLSAEKVKRANPDGGKERRWVVTAAEPDQPFRVWKTDATTRAEAMVRRAELAAHVGSGRPIDEFARTEVPAV